jgi:hypothetical protein
VNKYSLGYSHASEICAQIKSKQQGDLLRAASDRAKDCVSDLEADLPGPSRSVQAVNVAAVAWAYDQVDLPSPIAKVTLLVYAIHANSRGYSWPSTETIALVCCTDRTTVRRQIKALLDRRLLLATKKRFGITGQVKVYRLPKIAWQSGALRTALKKGQSGAKAVLRAPRTMNN